MGPHGLKCHAWLVIYIDNVTGMNGIISVWSVGVFILSFALCDVCWFRGVRYKYQAFPYGRYFCLEGRHRRNDLSAWFIDGDAFEPCSRVLCDCALCMTSRQEQGHGQLFGQTKCDYTHRGCLWKQAAHHIQRRPSPTPVDKAGTDLKLKVSSPVHSQWGNKHAARRQLCCCHRMQVPTAERLSAVCLPGISLCKCAS